MQQALRPFHLALPVRDIGACRTFYGAVLGCAEGRSAPTWVDFDFFGHQLVFHQGDMAAVAPVVNAVDDKAVPVPHFGIVLTWSDWEALADRLRHHEIAFIIEPYIRFAGKPGEQGTMFFADPNGLHLEFKAFKDDAQLFATT